jgi:DNA-binding NarL/FixJ family response regulator
MNTARFIVLENATVEAVREAIDDLSGDGAVVQYNWRARPTGTTVFADRVANVDDAGRAVLAAVRGARLVISADAPRQVIDQLCDDLRRLGEVDHRIEPSRRPVLSLEERALFAQLLAGATLGQAARTLHLSRRTADRRLAAARTALGARTTAEALRIAADLGLEPAGTSRTAAC